MRRVKIAKYLGIMVDDKLMWDQHVDYISSKITRSIGILKHIRHFIPQESLLLLYHTLIEPQFRYCCIVWGQCGETQKDKFQTLQNKAARTIAKLQCDESNHSDRLTKFAWLSVRNLVKLDTAVFVFKEINNLHPEQADSPLQMLDCLHSYNTRSVSNNNLFIPRGKTQNFQKTVPFSGSKIWNEMPTESHNDWCAPVAGYGGPWGSCEVFGVIVLMGDVVMGLWVSVLCLGFPYREAYLLGSGVCQRLHHLGVYANQNLLGTLPGDGVFGTLDFFWFPLSCGCGFSCGGLRVGWCLQAFFCAYSLA